MGKGGKQSGLRCGFEDVTDWETQPRIVRKLAENSVYTENPLPKHFRIFDPNKTRLGAIVEPVAREAKMEGNRQ